MNENNDTAPPSADDAALDRAIQALPRSRQPARDLWPGLEEQLQKQGHAQLPRPRPRRARFAWAAAAILAALFISVWVRPTLMPDSATTAPLAQVDALSAEASLLNEYETQKAAQMAALNFSSPAVNHQLAIWDGAVLQVRGALDYYPEEPQLLLQLDKLYRQQLHYLETLAMLDPQMAKFY